MEDLAERTTPNEKGDLQGNQTKSVRGHNEKRSERRANTERIVSDINNEVKSDHFFCICSLKILVIFAKIQDLRWRLIKLSKGS